MVSFNINSLSIPEEQQKKITEWEENAMTTEPTTAAARLVGGQIDAMKTAAGNTAGAMTGFMGMGMAAGAGGMGGMSAQNCSPWASRPARTAWTRPSRSAAPHPPRQTAGSAAAALPLPAKFCPECGSQKAGAEARCGQLDLQLRCHRHRQVLPGVRQAPPGGGRRLEVQLRRSEQGPLLLRVRPAQARRYAQV